MSESGKITASHLSRAAVIYVRQSTLIQVERNTESTARQYDLVHRARQLGWPREAIRVVDGDLGISGSVTGQRDGFEGMVAEVALGQVGVVLGIEMSRLARTGRDWHQLLELCSLSGVLLADPDGVYDPGVYNDRLLLGLKGTMSEMLCRYRHRTSYADIAVMPTMRCECAAALAGSASRSA
jgi:DNA invertase Pin-like site-specific DNA recombinase